jgi:hypothetical protein
VSETRRDLNLRLFLRYVADKKTPPQWLMEFIAEGVAEILKHGKPWPMPAGRAAKGARWPERSLSIKCFALNTIGVDKIKIVEILEIFTSDAAVSDKTLSRNIKSGEEFISAENIGPINYRLAIDELLEDCNLTAGERNSLESIKLELNPDDEEPSCD